MTKRTKQLKVYKDTWHGLKKLGEKHNKPICQLVDDLITVPSAKELDEILGLPKPPKKGRRVY